MTRPDPARTKVRRVTATEIEVDAYEVPMSQETEVRKQKSENPRMIEQAWLRFRAMLSGDPTDDQIASARAVFFAGAMCLFETIVQAESNQEEATADDLQRWIWIDEEIRAHKHEIIRHGIARRQQA